MGTYKVLNKQVFEDGEYSIVPIRFEDRFLIMQWRNEQIYHLRQRTPLTEDDQDYYFNTIVAKLFEQEEPNQLLFSYLKKGECLGYGGLVHINWEDKNAEISFIMDTALEKKYFESHWQTYLGLIEQVALQELKLHKIYTYAFDLRPQLYVALEKSGYMKEAHLKDHSLYHGNYLDVLIHAKIDNKIKFRLAQKKDSERAFSWVNDKRIRQFSINQKSVSWDEHLAWFEKKVEDLTNCLYLFAFRNWDTIGSVRYDIQRNVASISYLVDPDFQGLGIGNELIAQSLPILQKVKPNVKKIRALVLNQNLASQKIFAKNKFNIVKKNKEQTIFEKIIE